jgi:hypothetical protein
MSGYVKLLPATPAKPGDLLLSFCSQLMRANLPKFSAAGISVSKDLQAGGQAVPNSLGVNQSEETFAICPYAAVCARANVTASNKG